MKTKTYKQLTGFCLDIIEGTDCEATMLNKIRELAASEGGTVVITLNGEKDSVGLEVKYSGEINFLNVSSDFVELETLDNEGNQVNYVFQHIQN